MDENAPAQLLPVDDSHLPRHKRRFPFRPGPAEEAEVTRDISTVLTGIENLLHKLARRHLPDQMIRHELPDIVQACRVHLWRYSIPRFDRSRGVKLSTFLYRCVKFFFISQTRKFLRQPSLSIENWDFENVTDIDRRADYTVEQLAQEIITHPHRYLSASRAKALIAIIENPGVQMKDISKKLGYLRSTSFSLVKRQLAQQLQLAAQDLA